MAAGTGEAVIDFEFPEPEPPPVTTIAWRMGHIIVGVFGRAGGQPLRRGRRRLRRPSTGRSPRPAASTCSTAVRRVDRRASRPRRRGARRPCGPDEGPYADYPFAG